MSDVYFLFAHRANAIKIGVASNPHKRIRSIQTPEPCRLVGLMTGVGVEGEAALHGDFKHLRTHGEWFTATDELRAYVEQHAEGVPNEAWSRVEARPRKHSRNRQSQKRLQPSGGCSTWGSNLLHLRVLRRRWGVPLRGSLH